MEYYCQAPFKQPGRCAGRLYPNELRPVKKKSEQSLLEALASVTRLLSPCGKTAKRRHTGPETSACDPAKERRKNKKWKPGDITLNRQKHFRGLMRKEGSIYVPEYLIYKVEFPPRVTVRLEYLMRSSKVRLNDREYMERLYQGLIEEEVKNMDHVHEMREKAEQERVKKLVIEGILSL